MSLNPILQLGPTVLVAANATAPSGTRILCCGNNTASAIRVFNADANQTVHFSMGATAAEAQGNATIPTSAGNMSMGLPPLTVEVVRVRGSMPPNLFVSGITASASQANLQVTPVDGI